MLEFCFWILDLGFWGLEFCFLFSEFGSWSLDFWIWILDLAFWVSGTIKKATVLPQPPTTSPVFLFFVVRKITGYEVLRMEAFGSVFCTGILLKGLTSICPSKVNFLNVHPRENLFRPWGKKTILFFRVLLASVVRKITVCEGSNIYQYLSRLSHLSPLSRLSRLSRLPHLISSYLSTVSDLEMCFAQHPWALFWFLIFQKRSGCVSACSDLDMRFASYPPFSTSISKRPEAPCF